jgi:hypothetical protein
LKYFEVEEARKMPGLRLALTVGGPGPWSESAKAVFHVTRVPFAPVRQDSGDDNEALNDWTGHRNAPVAIFEDERPRSGWAEILLLAERLSEGPRLLPEAAFDRAIVFGLGHEICGEEGLGWSRRILMLDGTVRARTSAGKSPGRMGFMAGLYGYTPERVGSAHARVKTLLEMLSARLDAQRARGSSYFVGDALSAVDLYWACFATMFAPLRNELCPMSDALRGMYTLDDPTLRAALKPPLLAHRDFIYERHLALPFDF